MNITSELDHHVDFTSVDRNILFHTWGSSDQLCLCLLKNQNRLPTWDWQEKQS